MSCANDRLRGYARPAQCKDETTYLDESCDPRLLLLHLRQLGLLQVLGFRVYDASFFAADLRAQNAYADLAGVIYSTLTPASACDFGCGTALLIDALKGHGGACKRR